jgi:hypothetical protein
MANPDFDDIIQHVKYWLIECNTETGIPDREIGLDKDNLVILKMPYKTIQVIGQIITYC